jgi:hypothetical protein
VICPNCGAEYRPGFTRCSDCDVPLVESTPEPEGEPEPATHLGVALPPDLVDPVCVLRIGHAVNVALAKSILGSAGIPSVALNEEVQDLVGLGRFPAGFNVVVGPVLILVPRAAAEDARLMLAGLESVDRPSDDDVLDSDGHS